MPRQIDWLRTPEATVKGSTRARCETMRIEEWLRVTCLRVDGRLPTGISEVRGDRGEARVVVSEEAVTLVTPLFGEEAFAATFHWQGYAATSSCRRLRRGDRKPAGTSRTPVCRREGWQLLQVAFYSQERNAGDIAGRSQKRFLGVNRRGQCRQSLGPLVQLVVFSCG